MRTHNRIRKEQSPQTFRPAETKAFAETGGRKLPEGREWESFAHRQRSLANAMLCFAI